MSCFETSTFVKNAALLDLNIVKQACEKFHWQYTQTGSTLRVHHVGNNVNLHGEYALQVQGNQITYNRYYLRNGAELAQTLAQEVTLLNQQFVYESILTEFKKRGFTYLSDHKFKPTETEIRRFYMEGRSKIKNESEPITRIQFTIQADGTILTDSNYIPADVHEGADEAMEAIEHKMGCKRTIQPKEIPALYRHKAYCHPKTVLQNKTK